MTCANRENWSKFFLSKAKMKRKIYVSLNTKTLASNLIIDVKVKKQKQKRRMKIWLWQYIGPKTIEGPFRNPILNETPIFSGKPTKEKHKRARKNRKKTYAKWEYWPGSEFCCHFRSTGGCGRILSHGSISVAKEETHRWWWHVYLTCSRLLSCSLSSPSPLSPCRLRSTSGPLWPLASFSTSGPIFCLNLLNRNRIESVRSMKIGIFSPPIFLFSLRNRICDTFLLRDLISTGCESFCLFSSFNHRIWSSLVSCKVLILKGHIFTGYISTARWSCVFFALESDFIEKV